MAARATDSGGALAVAALHDLVAAAAFLAAHPLHAAYLLFFARHLAALAAFFGPLLVSTALLLAVLATVGGAAEWHGLSRTCGIAVAALRAELGPDGAGGTGLVAQLCSFVLGPGDAAAVDRVGEIFGGITGSCFVSEQEEMSLFLLGCKKEIAFALPLTDDAVGRSSFCLDHEGSAECKDEIDDKAVISEDSKGSDSEECCKRFVQEMEEAEEEQEVVIQEQGLISSLDMGDAIVEKRLECDPVSVEIKKCEPVQAKELEAQEMEMVEAIQVKELLQPVEPKGIEPGKLVKQRSSIAQRIKLWEAQVSGNFKTESLKDEEDVSVKFSLETESIKDAEKCAHFEADPCVEKCDLKMNITSKKQFFEEQEHSQDFKDVNECIIPSETETFFEQLETETFTADLSAEENPPAASNTELVPRVVQPEAELQEQECRRAQAEQECQIAQPEQETAEYKDDVTESPVRCNERESPLKSTSIAGRVHSRTSSENLISEGSPLHKEKEWKRTLACKLYEDRMQLKLCRDRAVVVEGSDNMDMLWEAYETGGSSGRSRGGVKSSKKVVEELVEEDEEEESEEQEDDDDEGSVRQLCCLQALKLSTKKMSFGGGKPSLAKISKVLKRMTALSRVGSRRSRKS